LVFAKRCIEGRYRDHSAFLGMLQAIMQAEDRKFRGKALTNLKYDASFDAICTNMALVSPRAYKMLQREFAGRTLRSMRYDLHQSHSLDIRQLIWLLERSATRLGGSNQALCHPTSTLPLLGP
jgi:hypothetical protein